jgi:hypothetical protein
MSKSIFRLASTALCAATVFGFIRAVSATPDGESAALAVAPSLSVFSEFHATMLEVNEAENPPYTGAAGFGKFIFNSATRQISYEVRFTGVVSVTASHIHRSVGLGVSGPAIVNFMAPGTFVTPADVLSGTATLSASQVEDLFAGRLYVNTHTPALPAGNIRGQIWPRESTRSFAAQLTGLFEVPPVESTGSGLALVAVNDKADRMFWNLAISGVETPTIAHIHDNVSGANGPVAFDLLAGATLTTGIPVTGSAPISASHFANLLEGRNYVNVHSESFSGGELRGQLRPLFSLREAVLKGENEVPPVVPSGIGRATFDVNNATGAVGYGVTVSDIPSATMAHIHSGTNGVNGGVLVNLLGPGQALNPATPLIGGAVVTNPVIRERMYDGSLYVNIHTVDQPTGALRGQVEAPVRFLTYRATLSGLNEVPPVTTTARGAAYLTLDTRTNELTFKVTTEGITVTAMHIHTGTAGSNGGVAFSLAPTGTVTLNAAQFDALNSQGFYVNVHSAANPGGELRGQIQPMIVPPLTSVLSGLNESPAVSTTATGAGSVVLDATNMQMTYRLSASNIVSVTAAHIHRGAAGSNGPVVVNLLGATALSSGGVLSGTLPTTPDILNELMSGGLYFNVHTTANPGGEIRGQLEVRRSIYLPLMRRE